MRTSGRRWVTCGLRFSRLFPLQAAGIPRIEVPEAPVENFTVVHPFSGGARKNWPLGLYRAVAERLFHVEWCAGPEEELDGAVRFDDLYELGCWLSRARVYIGNDSGISHLAAAVGVPVVAIFVSTDPRNLGSARAAGDRARKSHGRSGGRRRAPRQAASLKHRRPRRGSAELARAYLRAADVSSTPRLKTAGTGRHSTLFPQVDDGGDQTGFGGQQTYQGLRVFLHGDENVLVPDGGVPAG